MKRLAIMLTLGAALLAPASAQALTKAQATGKARARAEQNCYNKWGKSCLVVGIDASGPHANAFGKVQWYVHVFVEDPTGNTFVWEQYCAYDAFGNRLASSFTRLPITQDWRPGWRAA